MCKNNKQQTTNKGETWSRGKNSRLPFDVNVKLNLSTDEKFIWLANTNFLRTVSSKKD